MAPKQAFTRESADSRRDALIDACAVSLSRYGAQGTSVRTICQQAGVSPGLLRHYFEGIDALIAVTYRAIGARVAKALDEAVEAAGIDPRARLTAFVTANFRWPITDPDLLATWLAFWSLARSNPEIGRIHDEIYADNLCVMERLISACSRAPADQRLAAVGLTALVDGLWLELSLGSQHFTAADAEMLGRHWLSHFLDERVATAPR